MRKDEKNEGACFLAERLGAPFHNALPEQRQGTQLHQPRLSAYDSFDITDKKSDFKGTVLPYFPQGHNYKAYERTFLIKQYVQHSPWMVYEPSKTSLSGCIDGLGGIEVYYKCISETWIEKEEKKITLFNESWVKYNLGAAFGS